MAKGRSSRKASKQNGQRDVQERAGMRGTERGGAAAHGTEKKGARAGGGNGQGRKLRAAADTGGGGRQKRRNGGGNGRARSEREIEEMFGFVPSFYQAMPDAAFQHAWGLQRDVELKETALDPITKELIGLAVAAHIKCRYCIYFHTEAALHHGATHEQLQEAIAMGGLTVLWSNAVTGAQIDLDHFRGEVDRALEHVGRSQPAQTAMRHATA